MKSQLKIERFNKQKTQYELAKESGVAQSRISLYENGLINLSQKEKRLISEALKADPKELFQEA